MRRFLSFFIRGMSLPIINQNFLSRLAALCAVNTLVYFLMDSLGRYCVKLALAPDDHPIFVDVLRTHYSYLSLFGALWGLMPFLVVGISMAYITRPFPPNKMWFYSGFGLLLLCLFNIYEYIQLEYALKAHAWTAAALIEGIWPLYTLAAFAAVMAIRFGVKTMKR